MPTKAEGQQQGGHDTLALVKAIGAAAERRAFESHTGLLLQMDSNKAAKFRSSWKGHGLPADGRRRRPGALRKPSSTGLGSSQPVPQLPGASGNWPRDSKAAPGSPLQNPGSTATYRRSLGGAAAHLMPEEAS